MDDAKRVRFECKKCRYITNNNCEFNRHKLTRKHIGCVKRAELDDAKRVGFACEKCCYITNNNYNFNRHILSLKHISLSNGATKTKYECQKCQKVYKYKQGLNKHNKACGISGNKIFEHELVGHINSTISDNELIKIIIEQNQILQQQVQEQNKQMQEQNKQILELIPKVGNNNNNKTKFNINLYLNTECKDAINLSEFIKSLKITLSDLTCTQNNGLLASTQNVIVNGLKSLEQTKRPIHCTDDKRKIMYVKEDGKWDKDNDNEKIKDSIKITALKQANNISLWEHENPEYVDKKEDFENYVKLMIETCKEVNVGEMEPIVKSIGKETKIDINI